MGSYIIRLDDAAEKRDISKWNQIEQMLDAYGPGGSGTAA